MIRPDLCLATLASALFACFALAQEPTSVPRSGREELAFASLDKLLEAVVLKDNAVGVSLAVAKEGRLVYARGFGFANRDAKECVAPTSRFRIASISKPLTAIVILRLVEQGKLALDDRVVQVLDLEKRVTDSSRFDPGWRDITIRQLLCHLGGWDRNISFDPMFQSIIISVALGRQPPASANDVIDFMLSQPFDYKPGERHSYSNFGYNLLGRVIEKATGSAYEEYLRSGILAELGIAGMRIGDSLECYPGEVSYYDERGSTGLAVVGQPIGRRVPSTMGTWNHASLDAHGGWIASAAELVRLGSALRFAPGPILSEKLIAEMLAPPEGTVGHHPDGRPKTTYYALGWSVRAIDGKGNKNYWHSGSLPGTSTRLVCRADGIVWAVLFNSRANAKGHELAGLMDARINKALDAVESWPKPEGDLFPEYLGGQQTTAHSRR